MSDFAAEHPVLDTARAALYDVVPAVAAGALARRLGAGTAIQLLAPMAAAGAGALVSGQLDPRDDVGSGLTLLGVGAGTLGALSNRSRRLASMRQYMRTSHKQRTAQARKLHADIMAHAPADQLAQFRELADPAARSVRRMGPRAMYYAPAATGALAGAGYGMVGDRLLANLKLKEQANDDHSRSAAGE